jgi:hypothetical protein
LEKFRPLIHTAHRTIVSSRRSVEGAEVWRGKCVIALPRTENIIQWVTPSHGEVVS